jgi:hypothetical protein
MMILGRNVWEQDGVLTVPQRLSLLSGFHDLVQLCDLLEKQEPPEITHSACASSRSLSLARCRSGWIEIWNAIFDVRDMFFSLSPADYIGRLSLVATILRRLDEVRPKDLHMAAGCLKSGLAEVEAMSEECTRSLPDLFVDLK